MDAANKTEPTPTAAISEPSVLPAISRNHWVLFCLVLLAAIFVRSYQLNSLPPGLWYDEALYSLDGYKVYQGHFPLFFDEGGHPREPLYPWCLGIAFKLFSPLVIVARSVSAFWGIIAVALFFPAARYIFRNNSWALLATAAFALFRWHVHFSRTIFRALLPSAFMLAVVWLFFRWRDKKRTIDAALCGAAMGAGLYTYISFRVTPVLVTAWIGWLLLKKQINLKTEWKQIAALYAAALLVFAPLGIDYIKNPYHLFGRTDEITLFEKTVQVTNPDGTTTEKRVPRPTGEAIAEIGANALSVAKMWTITGDHVAKHNVPYRPVFDWVSGTFFYIGVIWAIAFVTRSLPAFILLTWLITYLQASVFSFGAPNILRTQGASPAAILLMIIGLKYVFELPAIRSKLKNPILVPCIVVAYFSAMQMYDYFGRFANSVAARQQFTADTFYAPAAEAVELAKTHQTVYIPEELAATLPVKFVTINSPNIVPYKPDAPLPVTDKSAAYILTERSLELAATHHIDQQTQVRTMPEAKFVKTLTLPIPDENDRPAVKQPWAYVWKKD